MPTIRSWLCAIASGVVLAACASPPSEEPSGDSSPAPPAESATAVPDVSVLDSVVAPSSPPPAPWTATPLARAAVPDIYMKEWERAENRSTCRVIAPASVGGGDTARATPRRAIFAGGWAVAYDLPGTRSAFGVAGTGSSATDTTYDAWPNTIRWADSSSAGYGPEGGSGPNELAYLRITGQGCLYNVWSRLGQPHLERLLAQLRFVE